MQYALDDALRAPRWVGFALLGLAIAVTIPGRHGQRPLNAAVLGAGAGALCFFGLRGVGPAWVPGVAAIIAGALGTLFGAAAEAWGTAALLAGVLGGSAALAARVAGLLWFPLAILFCGIGLYAGMVKRKRLSVVLPPIFAAPFAAVGAAIAWAPHWRGAALWQLNDVEWVLALSAALLVPLLAIALEREHRRELRKRNRTRQMDDEDLKKELAKGFR